ncbi:MAG: hypothetical protein OSB45_11540, partial [Pseudomonadales bacterium]|nr:hypothetical protein [Pseudomonadales bacterium]
YSWRGPFKGNLNLLFPWNTHVRPTFLVFNTLLQRPQRLKFQLSFQANHGLKPKKAVAVR